MQKYISSVKFNPLFGKISDADLPSLLSCLSATVRSYEKGEMIFAAGQKAENVGLVCSGKVHVFFEDYMGNRNIISPLDEGDLFGEAFACAGTQRLPVSVMAVARSEIMLIDYKKIVSTCPTTCEFHSKLIENMLGIVAAKNVALSQKMEILSKRNTREKIIAYLSAQALRAGSRKFTIPLDRQGLADYLCVERSAMSVELSKMQREGLIRTNKSEFEIAET